QCSYSSSVDLLFQVRGAFMAFIAPLFVATAGLKSSLKVKLSRAATFQSISLLGICIYLATMTGLATAFRRTHWDWATASTSALLFTMVGGVGPLLVSPWARGWMKVKLSKHLFEHRYDYRTEWLRFTDTIGRSGEDAAPLADRIIQGFSASA